MKVPCCQEVSEVESGESAICCQEVSEVEFGEGVGDIVKTGVSGEM